MNKVLWLLQTLLAVVFLAHGWLFLAPPPEVAEQMNASLPRWFQLSLGTAEVLAAVGLVVPALTRVLPWLVEWAALGIMIVMVSATASPGPRRDEFSGGHGRASRHGVVRGLHAALRGAARTPAGGLIIGSRPHGGARHALRMACRL